MLNRNDAQNIINLNPYGVIDEDIANRQFDVIIKAFNYLIQEENKFIYIADEVGLGKTYVALGIASLLRRFCEPERRAVYKDLIIVPKQNLQYKWVKEVNNFIKDNYLQECNIVKSVLGTPIGTCNWDNIHHQLEGFDTNTPSYEIFRNSSFSIATSSDPSDWQQKLEELTAENLKPIYRKARMLFGQKEEYYIFLKRVYAYLLNISFPQVDLLIVDEAHNFKHGIGDQVAIRNQIVSRIMGNIQDEDHVIFDALPELDKNRIQAKAKKIIFLSATPIDNGLHEIKQQLDCFLPTHPFQHSEHVGDAVKNSIKTFMIRGLMNIKLDQEQESNGFVSRNMYRHEHRRGNVIKQEIAQPQYIQDDLESIVLGLVQYKTLKHFNESNSKNFEIGMLAGFETFNTRSISEQEYEETSNRNTIKSADQNTIQHLSTSFFDHFKTQLPHPKQDNLVNVLFEGIKKQTKSLVFVRRIASVVELEKKLNAKIEDWQYEKIKKYIHRSGELKTLSMAFEQRHDIQKIENILGLLAEKVLQGNRTHFKDLIQEDGDHLVMLNEILLVLYYSESKDESTKHFQKLVFEHLNRNSIRTVLKALAFDLTSEFINRQNALSKREQEEQFTESQEDIISYFFSSYFSSKRYVEGFNFRKRFGTKDWYKFNYFHLKGINNRYHFDTSMLGSIQFEEKVKTPAQKMDVLNEKLIESLASFQNNNATYNYTEVDPLFMNPTFLNRLLEGPLQLAYRAWVKKKMEQATKGFSFIDDLDALIEIFQGIFRNGSGLVPAYVAECLNPDQFEQTLIKLLETDFPEIILELNTILIDFDKIMSTNFSDRTKIQRSLYGQYPVTGASGHHKRDISRLATQFRMPGYPYVLISTDVLKEGEDLHLYCKDVYHYGIAWNPSDMEQRTGRIDRINSQCYFELKKDGKRMFENSLQVFYPYLADTLEVNQVAKVFHKMNDFIQTFYDISITQEKDSQVATDTIVKEIPEQIKDLLVSKYDHDNGNWPHYEGITTLDLNTTGYKKSELIIQLEQEFELLKELSDFEVNPQIENDWLQIRAVSKINNRRAPIRIKMIKGKAFDEVIYTVESNIGKSTHSELRKREIRNKIMQELRDTGMELIENNNYLVVRKLMSFDIENAQKKSIIHQVLITADALEQKYTDEDDEGF